MNELVKKISKIPCVNGSEFVLSDYLLEYFREKGFFTTIYPGGHILIRQQNSTPHTIVFTPMDSPGFICLYKQADIAYLSPTSKKVNDLKDIEAVFDYNGNKFSSEESNYDKIKSKEINIGNALAISSSLKISKTCINGRFSGRFACICILMKLAEALKNPNVGICFTAGFYSNTKAESNIINRLHAKNAILLGFGVCNLSNKHPILAIKDGKHFSSPRLSELFKLCCRNNHIPFQSVVFDKAITAAERLFSPSEILSLALPCQFELTINEKVYAAEEMLSALTVFLNSDI